MAHLGLQRAVRNKSAQEKIQENLTNSTKYHCCRKMVDHQEVIKFSELAYSHRGNAIYSEEKSKKIRTKFKKKNAKALVVRT